MGSGRRGGRSRGRAVGQIAAVGLAAQVLLSSSALLFGMVVSSGCGAEAGLASDEAADAVSSTDSAEPSPQAQVGGADDDGKGFVDWSSGQAQPPIIRGPQGGQHIWVSAHVRNVYPNKARVAVTMYLVSGTQASVVSPGRVEMIGNLKGDGDWLIYPGIAAFVKEPCKIYGKNVRVDLEVDDLYGRRASDQQWIRPTWDGPCD